MKVRLARPWACLAVLVLQALVPCVATRAQSSQRGRITGDICDESGKPLDFANLLLVGTTMGAMTRNGGRFEIKDIPAGEYEIKASFVGYDPKTLRVTVEPNRTSVVSFCGGMGSTPPQVIDRPPNPGGGELFRVYPGGAIDARLPLRRTNVRAAIAGNATDVIVEQTFENSNAEPIEALYVFPLPHRAALTEMRMQIGERVIRAEVRKRQEAAQIYALARHEGRVAALLEQERPNIFTQHVANILPGHDVVVRIRYFEELQWDGRYELVVPTVVGPRYIPGAPKAIANLPASAPPPSSEGGVQSPPSGTGLESGIGLESGAGWSPDTDRVPDASRITPFVLPPGADSGHDFDVVVEIDAGIPLEEIESVNHAVEVTREGKDRAVVRLRPTDTIPNKDFVLRYSVEQDRLHFGVLAHRESERELGYFTLAMRPPSLPERSDTQALALDLVLVLDVSGSMQGAPLEKEKGVVRWILQRLRPQDRFTVIQFANVPRRVLPTSQPGTAANLEAALRYIETMSAGGGTEMLDALRLAMEVKVEPQRQRVLCMLTDGLVGNDSEIIHYVQANLGGGRLFVIGIGSSPNRYVVDGLAEAGLGAHDFVALDENPRYAAERFFERIESPILSDISIEWGGLQVQDVQPNPLPSLFAGKPLQITGRYRAAGAGNIVIQGRRGGRSFVQRMRVRLPALESRHAELGVLWARQRIHDLERPSPGRNVDNAREVEKLGLEFALMTRYTSFVATDNQVVTDGGVPKLVPQPVEMPQGVRHEGVFGRAGGGLKRGVAGVVQTITVTSESHKVDIKSSDVADMNLPPAVNSLPSDETKEAALITGGLDVTGGEPGVRGGRSGKIAVRLPAGSPAPVGPGTAAVPTVRIELEARELEGGRRVSARIIIENSTGQAIAVPDRLRLGDGSLQIEVIFGDILFPSPERLEHQDTRTTLLQPGERHTYTIPLDEIDGYVFSRPGTYKIRFLRVAGIPISERESEQTLTVH